MGSSAAYGKPGRIGASSCLCLCACLWMAPVSLIRGAVISLEPATAAFQWNQQEVDAELLNTLNTINRPGAYPIDGRLDGYTPKRIVWTISQSGEGIERSIGRIEIAVDTDGSEPEWVWVATPVPEPNADGLTIVRLDEYHAVFDVEPVDAHVAVVMVKDTPVARAEPEEEDEAPPPYVFSTRRAASYTFRVFDDDGAYEPATITATLGEQAPVSTLRASLTAAQPPVPTPAPEPPRTGPRVDKKVITPPRRTVERPQASQIPEEQKPAADIEPQPAKVSAKPVVPDEGDESPPTPQSAAPPDPSSEADTEAESGAAPEPQIETSTVGGGGSGLPDTSGGGRRLDTERAEALWEQAVAWASGNVNLILFCGFAAGALALLIVLPIRLSKRRAAARRIGAAPTHARNITPHVAEVMEFGDYEILEEIGRGGMGVVYRARKPENADRLMALKVPFENMLHDEEFRERFLRQAEIGAQLSHPHIVTILDSGEFDGVPYIAMEHVEGVDLRVRLDEDGQLPVGVAASYVIQICEALDYVHLKQIFHRDLKPENVLATIGGVVKVMDFGIALAKGMPRLSTDGVRWLSGGYLCPDREVTAASDLYMLGVLFYEMLAGRLPFVSDDLIQLLRMHEEAAVPPIDESRPDVPGEVEAVARKLLEVASEGV